MRYFEIYFDGSCYPRNPGGKCGYGVAVYENGKVVYQEGGIVGEGRGMTNNVGEWAGLHVALLLAQKKPADHITIYGDSNLVIKQCTKRWRIKFGCYVGLAEKTVELYRSLPKKPDLQWIPREENTRADYLSTTKPTQRKTICPVLIASYNRIREKNKTAQLFS